MPLILHFDHPSDDFRTEAAARIKILRCFIEETRKAMVRHRTCTKRSLDRTLKETIVGTTCPADEEVNVSSVIWMHYAAHMDEFGRDIPRLLNYSNILQVYSCFEEVGRRLCEEISKRDNSLPLTFSDLRSRNDYDAIQLFVTKLCRVQFNKWSTLAAFKKIRNLIIHEGGMVGGLEADQKKLIKSLSPLKEFRFTHAGRIDCSSSHVSAFLDTMVEFFDSVFEQCGFGPASPYSFSGGEGGLIVDEKPNGKFKVKLLGSEGFW